MQVSKGIKSTIIHTFKLNYHVMVAAYYTKITRLQINIHLCCHEHEHEGKDCLENQGHTGTTLKKHKKISIMLKAALPLPRFT